MSSFSHGGDRATATPARQLGMDADAAQAARVQQTIWSDIDAAIMPIVGGRGLAALRRRSVHLTGVEFAWLASANDGETDVQQGIEAICALMAVQDDAAAAACAQAFLRNFRELLVTLIGASLTERLLRPAWTDPLSGAAAQDPSS